jgi:hypothetical protein
MKTLLTAILICIASTCSAADVKLSWDPSDGAVGYKIYMSTDQGQTWTAGIDVGAVVTYQYTGVQDAGLTLFRVSAYNGQGEAVRYNAGAWYCGDWKPPAVPTGVGVE